MQSGFLFWKKLRLLLDKENPENLLNTAVILDISSKDSGANTEGISWNPIQIGDSITDIAATLVLMFPEVYWIFVGMEGNMPSPVSWVEEHFVDPLVGKGMEKCTELLTQHRFGYCPLFDPSGLRTWIKKKIQKVLEKSTNDPEEKPSAEKLSASIDEEMSYAFLHGYLAYKLGHRSYVVTTLSMMGELFKDNTKAFDLVFEDIFTSFPDPDKDTDFHSSDLKERYRKFKGFNNVRKTIFVTVGHKHINWYDKNKEYIRALKAEGKQHIKMVYKPSGGLYNLLEKAGLFKDYWTKAKKEWRDATPKKEEKNDGHSAPGKILLISEKLIDRAKKIYHNEAQSVKDCIYGATLALEARNLLSYKTPTTCLESIALRHKLEVKAECLFYGVGYNIDVKNRFRELEGEIQTISKWFNPSVKESSSLNARMSVITEVMQIFGESGQFDEEQECLKYFRKLNRQWYFLRKPWMMPFQPIRWYVETMVGSFHRFVLAVLCWPVIMGGLSYTFVAKLGNVSGIPI